MGSESIVGATVAAVAVSTFPFDAPEEKLGKKVEESPVGSPNGRVEVFCETDACTFVEDEKVDVVGGIDDVGVSGYVSDGFTLLEILRRQTLLNKSVPEGGVAASHLPQCVF